jgi:hypothetical protein
MIPARGFRLPPKTDPAAFTLKQLENFKRLIKGAVQ